jgi:hypothetical protein
MPTAVKTEQEIYGERAKYIEREFGALKGKTIAVVRPLTKAECDQFAWDYNYDSDAMAIFFTDGTVVVPSQDPEGNGAGFLFVIESTDRKAK